MDDYDDYYDDYSDDYDSDDFYGGVDPVTFQIGGYGGFGYDTSHVKPDDKQPAIVEASKLGDLAKVKSILEEATTAVDKPFVLNASRRWTEVDYRYSGFTKEYEWHDATPITGAAYCGHPEIVEYLLRQGADPTLQCCWTDNVYFDAFGAAKKNHEQKMQRLSYVRNIQASTISSMSETSYELHGVKNAIPLDEAPTDIAKKLLEIVENSIRCVTLLECIKPFWSPPSYRGERWSNDRKTQKYSNRPSDMTKLLQSLDSLRDKSIEDTALEGYSAEELKVHIGSLHSALQELENKQRLKQEKKPAHARNNKRLKQKKKPGDGGVRAHARNQKFNLHLSGYGEETTKADILNLFSPHVTVESVFLKKQGFAFVNTQDPANAKKAMEILNGTLLGGLPVRINPAHSNERK